MKRRKLLSGAVFGILLAGCAVEHDPVTQQAGMAQREVSRYVAVMSEQPGQIALKRKCEHARSWTRLDGLTTENEGEGD
jgi:hypothetical protein